MPIQINALVMLRALKAWPPAPRRASTPCAYVSGMHTLCWVSLLECWFNAVYVAADSLRQVDLLYTLAWLLRSRDGVRLNHFVVIFLFPSVRYTTTDFIAYGSVYQDIYNGKRVTRLVVLNYR